MRVLNGLFAFATMLAVVALCSMSRSQLDPISFFVWLLIFWHVVWFSATRPGLDFAVRWARTLGAGIVCLPAALALNLIFSFSATPVTRPMLCILAVGELIYCLRVICLSLPPSLVLGTRRKALSPNPVRESLPTSPMSAVELRDKQV